MAGLIEHEAVFDRGACLRATVICLLVLGLGRPVERSRRTIMPQRGEMGTSFVGVVVRRVGSSAAVRAGSPSCSAHARFKTVWRR